MARYNLLIKYCLPELSQAEKAAYIAIYDGYKLNDDIQLELQEFSMNVSEFLDNKLEVKEILNAGNINPNVFLGNAQEYTFPQRLAIIDMTQRHN